MKKEELIQKLIAMGTPERDAKRIANIHSRSEAVKELKNIKDVRIAAGGGEDWRIQDAMKKTGIYYEFKS